MLREGGEIPNSEVGPPTHQPSSFQQSDASRHHLQEGPLHPTVTLAHPSGTFREHQTRFKFAAGATTQPTGTLACGVHRQSQDGSSGEASCMVQTRAKNEVGAVYLSKLATVDCFLKKCLHRRHYCTLLCGTHTHCPSIKGLATGWPAEVDHSELAAETLTSSIVPCPLVLAVFLVPSSTDP